MTSVLLNSELNGVEIYFEDKPLKTIIDNLKSVSFRWNGLKKCWYAKQSEKTIAEAKKYTDANNSNLCLTEAKTQQPKKNISLWDLTRWAEGTVNKSDLELKTIASEIKKQVKVSFSMCKFSVTSSHNSIRFYITASPFEKESIYLNAIAEYCTSLLKSYNYCTCDDPYGDYGSSYNFYGAYANIDYNYEQTEQTEAIKDMIKDFDTKKIEAEKLEEERKEKEYQESLILQAEQHKQYELRMAEEKKEIDFINNSVNVAELKENKQYFIIGSQFANLNKNNTLEQYQEEVLNSKFTLENVKITREIHFQNKESLNYFSKLLLNDFDFLQGEQTGGSYTDDERINSMTDYYNMDKEEQSTVKWNLYGVAIYLDNKLQFVVDTQGYSYARYVGLVNNITIQNDMVTESTIEHNKLEELQTKAETLKDISTDVITSNNMVNTWNTTNWNEYKKLIKIEFKNYNFRLTRSIIQQITEDMEVLKIAMYKLLVDVDGIQEQFKTADIQQGQKMTMFYISDWGGIVTSRVTFDKVENTTYAQYNNAVKLTFTPQGKKKLYYNHFYSTMIVYNGWLELPTTVLNEVTENNGFICTKSKYGSCDNKQYDEIMNYFKQQELKPIINTYKPTF